MSAYPRARFGVPSSAINFPDLQTDLQSSADSPLPREQPPKLRLIDHLVGGIGLVIVLSIVLVDAYLVLRDLL